MTRLPQPDAFDEGYLGIDRDDESPAERNLEAYLRLMRAHLDDWCEDDDDDERED